jgi:hypothetical protein
MNQEHKRHNADGTAQDAVQNNLQPQIAKRDGILEPQPDSVTPKNPAQSAILTEAEEMALLSALDAGTQAGFTQGEAETVLLWAKNTRVNQSLLDLAIEGRIAIHFRGGEPAFFTISQANAAAEAAQTEPGEASVLGHHDRETTKRQEPWWVTVRDEDVPSYNDFLVWAVDSDEAERRAVAERNADNGYGEHEDGGFVAVAAYNRSDLRRILRQMDACL